MRRRNVDMLRLRLTAADDGDLLLPLVCCQFHCEMGASPYIVKQREKTLSYGLVFADYWADKFN